MPFYCVQSKASAGPMRTYWIDAKSVDQARTLVALNVASAANARDAALFDCMLDDTKKTAARSDLQRQRRTDENYAHLNPRGCASEVGE